jgi:transposase
LCTYKLVFAVVFFNPLYQDGRVQLRAWVTLALSKIISIKLRQCYFFGGPHPWYHCLIL